MIDKAAFTRVAGSQRLVGSLWLLAGRNASEEWHVNYLTLGRVVSDLCQVD